MRFFFCSCRLPLLDLFKVSYKYVFIIKLWKIYYEFMFFEHFCNFFVLFLFRLFAMLSSGKNKICQKDLILPSAIFYCVQFHTPKLHTYIQLEWVKTKQSEFINLVVSVIYTKILPIKFDTKTLEDSFSWAKKMRYQSFCKSALKSWKQMRKMSIMPLKLFGSK